MTRRNTNNSNERLLFPTATTRALGIGLSTLVAAGIVMHESGNSSSPESEAQNSATATAHVTATIEGANDNWGHDTAKNLLLTGAAEATAGAIAKLNPEDTTTTSEDIAALIDSHDTYTKVREMLAEAAEDGQLAQPGDIISSDISATVTEVSSNNGEYNYTVDFSASNTEYEPK